MASRLAARKRSAAPATSLELCSRTACISNSEAAVTSAGGGSRHRLSDTAISPRPQFQGSNLAPIGGSRQRRPPIDPASQPRIRSGANSPIPATLAGTKRHSQRCRHLTELTPHEAPIVVQGLWDLGLGISWNIDETCGFVEAMGGGHERTSVQNKLSIAE